MIQEQVKKKHAKVPKYDAIKAKNNGKNVSKQFHYTLDYDIM